VTTHHGAMPLNSRVTVDYGDRGFRQPRVYFSYPRKCTSRIKWALRYVFPVLLVAWIIPMVLITLGMIFGMMFATIPMLLINPVGTIAGFNWFAPMVMCDAFVFFFYMLLGVVPILASFGVAYNYERFAKTFPLYMACHMTAYQIEIRKVSGKVYTLPLFKNIFLDYEATGDFGEQLRKIVIREMPGIKRPGHKKWRNDVLWFARFEFKRKPRNRSEERRVGKECKPECRSRWSPYH
jgi:hypothetical protein